MKSKKDEFDSWLKEWDSLDPEIKHEVWGVRFKDAVETALELNSELVEVNKLLFNISDQIVNGLLESKNDNFKIRSELLTTHESVCGILNRLGYAILQKVPARPYKKYKYEGENEGEGEGEGDLW